MSSIWESFWPKFAGVTKKRQMIHWNHHLTLPQTNSSPFGHDPASFWEEFGLFFKGQKKGCQFFREAFLPSHGNLRHGTLETDLVNIMDFHPFLLQYPGGWTLNLPSWRIWCQDGFIHLPPPKKKAWLNFECPKSFWIFASRNWVYEMSPLYVHHQEMVGKKKTC